MDGEDHPAAKKRSVLSSARAHIIRVSQCSPLIAECTVSFTAHQAGHYKLICTTHGATMIAVVLATGWRLSYRSPRAGNRSGGPRW